MSRFYDAVRRAGNSLPFDREEAESAAFPPLEEDGIEAEKTVSRAEDFDHKKLGASEKTAKGEKFTAPSFEVPHRRLGTSVQTSFNRNTRVIVNVPDSAVLEQYRLLRTKLLQLQQEKLFRSLVITSPCPREGKTVTTLNLALTYGLLPERKVLVVEGDLRRGSIGEALRLGPTPGLSELLEGSVELEKAILKPENIPVSFIVRGNSTLPPGELLHSERLPSLIQELTRKFDLILFDSPPVNMVSDTQLLAACCDGVLLVARAFATSFKNLQEASQALPPNQVIGTILNGGVRLSPYYGYRSYY